MSKIGVPSIASKPFTVSLFFSTFRTSQTVIPILFSLFFALCAKMPTLGKLRLFLGCLDSKTILESSTLWK